MQQINKLEKGSLGINRNWLDKLANALNCNPADFINPEFNISQHTEVPSAVQVDDDLMKACAKALEVVLLQEKAFLKEKDYLDVCVDLYNYVLEQQRKYGHCEPNPTIAEHIYGIYQQASA